MSDLTNRTMQTGAHCLQGVKPLVANAGLSSRGMALHGTGFIVTPAEAEALGLGTRHGLEAHIRPYRNGRDLTATRRDVMVIDLFGVEASEVQERFPEVYQHLLRTVKQARQAQFDRSPTRDAKHYLERWWLHGRPREELRPALRGLRRYIITVETAIYRIFQFLDGAILPDNRLVCIASDDAFILGVLSSKVHFLWTLRAGGALDDRLIYTKSACFDPFPFPACSETLKGLIRAAAEELDALRKLSKAKNPRLTLTQIYDVLEILRSGESLDNDEFSEAISSQGHVAVLRELHDKLDTLVMAAYGWTDCPSNEDIISRLVKLNDERTLEEKTGHMRWLRPDYQVGRYSSAAERARLVLDKTKARQDN